MLRQGGGRLRLIQNGLRLAQARHLCTPNGGNGLLLNAETLGLKGDQRLVFALTMMKKDTDTELALMKKDKDTELAIALMKKDTELQLALATKDHAHLVSGLTSLHQRELSALSQRCVLGEGCSPVASATLLTLVSLPCLCDVPSREQICVGIVFPQSCGCGA